MSEMDHRTSNAIAEQSVRRAAADLRAEWSPPSGAEERMLADFHARLGPPDGGGDGGELAGGDGGASSAATAGQGVYFAKIVGAVAGLTAAGLGGLVIAAKLVGTHEAPEPPRERAAVIAIEDREPLAEPSVERDEAASPILEDAPEPELESAPIASVSPKRDKLARESQQVDLAAELALIQRARTAEPEQALALLDRHAREFSKGALSSEREALRAVASCKLDRLDDARAAIERLSALDPGPLLRQRVRAACGDQLDFSTTDSTRGGDRSP
jgi:hypothetical protein